nr:uncharacterized protein LOC127347627 [Lolium perenne]
MSETESHSMAHLEFDLGVEGDGSGSGTGIGSGPTNSTPVSSVKKQMNKRSKIWQHFTVHENDPNRAVCNYCGSNLGCKSSSAGTSSLINHMKSCKKNPSKLGGHQTELVRILL